MAEVDTSSYPKPRPSKGIQEQISGWNQIEQQEINIDKSKLELAIKNQENLYSTLAALPPDSTAEDFKKWGQNAVKMKLVNPRIFAETMTNLPAMTGDPVKDREAIQRFRSTLENRMIGNLEAMKWKYGQDINVDTGNQTIPGKLDPRTGVPRPTSAPFQKQLPIGSEYIDPNTKETRRVGPELPMIPEGTEPVPGGFPNQFRPSNNSVPIPQPRPNNVGPLPVGPITDPRIKGESRNFGGNILGATVEPPSNFNDRFGLTKRAPGEAEAEVATGQQSGQALATARQRAASYAQDIFPVTEALTAAKNLGTKGTGPGSETLNYLKSFILTNLPGIQENDPEFKTINDFDKLQKYLVQIAKTTGNTNTNDQLAASFAGNPNIKMSNAATQDVLASIYALRTLDLAKTKVWEKQNLPDSQYAKWAAKWDNDIDPRAFGIQWMNPDAIVKLDKSLKGKAREKFNNSVNIARELGLM